MDIAVIGCGARGSFYSKIAKNSGLGSIVAVCDPNQERLDMAQKELDVPTECLYTDLDEFFKAGKLAELCIVATQDKQHLEHATRAMKAGYHLLLEKPIATNLEDVMEIYNVSVQEKRKVYVCHVLRYAPFYSIIKDELASGKYGKYLRDSRVQRLGFSPQCGRTDDRGGHKVGSPKGDRRPRLLR